jgi:hypothetical protein
VPEVVFHDIGVIVAQQRLKIGDFLMESVGKYRIHKNPTLRLYGNTVDESVFAGRPVYRWTFALTDGEGSA